MLLNLILLKYVIMGSKYRSNHLKRNLYNKFHITILISQHYTIIINPGPFICNFYILKTFGKYFIYFQFIFHLLIIKII